MSIRDSRGGGPEKKVQLDPTLPIFNQNPMMFEQLVGYNDNAGKWIPGLTMMLYVDGGVFKLCLKDKHFKKIGFAVLNPCLKLSGAIEEVLDAGGIEWRPDREKH